MDRNLESYIQDHSTPEDPVLEDLYRQTHVRFVNPNMVSGHMQGKLLEMISMMIRPDNILEIGTFTGYSAICLAKGLKQGGRLYTIECNDELQHFSCEYIRKAGLTSSIMQLTGRAQDIIPGIEVRFDLVFIDGDKREYVSYYKLVREKVRSGGFILADNVLWGGKVSDRNIKDPQAKGIIAFNDHIREDDTVEKLILPLRDGLMIIRKK
jgi:predicted O-methyltransferase YrrM